jgi:hypothetical protein
VQLAPIDCSVKFQPLVLRLHLLAVDAISGSRAGISFDMLTEKAANRNRKRLGLMVQAEEAG